MGHASDSHKAVFFNSQEKNLLRLMVTDFSLNLALLPPLDQSKCIFPPLHFSFVTYKMWDNNPYVINNNDNYMRKCIQLKSKNKYYFLIDISTK